jgi:hypothetical protein
LELFSYSILDTDILLQYILHSNILLKIELMASTQQRDKNTLDHIDLMCICKIILSGVREFPKLIHILIVCCVLAVIPIYAGNRFLRQPTHTNALNYFICELWFNVKMELIRHVYTATMKHLIFLEQTKRKRAAQHKA